MSEGSREQRLEEEEEDGINLLDYLIVLAKRKKLIISITLFVAIITVISTLCLPNMYLAKTTVMLPQASTGPAWMRMLSEYSGESSVSSNITDPNLFIQLLYTGPVLNKIIDQFDLARHYGEKISKRDLRDTLSSSVKTEFILPAGSKVFSGATSRLLMLSVTDRDPEKAADMANAFVEALQDFLKDIAVTEASQKRLFIGEQLKQAQEGLIRSEEAMRAFQEKTGAFKVEEQASAVFESIASLRAQIVAKEVELSVMKSYTTPNNPDLQRVEETIRGLKKELSKIEKKGESGSDIILTTGQIPEIGTDYIRKLRDLKYNETLYEMMMKQYEIAKIEEARDPAIIQVLEKAAPSEERAGPERRKTVTKATAAAFAFSIFLVFIMEFFERQKAVSPENRERIETLKRYLSFKKIN